MTRRPISAAAIAAAALLATLGSAEAQTRGTQDDTSTQSQSTVSGQASGSTMDSGASVSGSVQGSVTTDSPSASPSTMSPDEESAKARGLDPSKKPGLNQER